jgi:putative transposase
MFIDTHRARFGVEPICRTLGIAPSTYYARKTRAPSQRASKDARLLERIRAVHHDNYGAYGSRRVWKALRRQGEQAPRCRVERLMRVHGLRGAQPGKRRWLTVADETASRPADLVERRFTAERPNQLWVCDLTYLKTREGFVYLALVKDVFSRMIVGWQTATHLRTDSSWTRWRWPSICGAPTPASSCSTSIAAVSTRACAIRSGWPISASPRRSARSPTPTTTRWPRASSAR